MIQYFAIIFKAGNIKNNKFLKIARGSLKEKNTRLMTFILDRFLSLFNGGMKAYKVQDVKREQRIGVTAKNFQELLEKGAEKLKARFSL